MLGSVISISNLSLLYVVQKLAVGSVLKLCGILMELNLLS